VETSGNVAAACRELGIKRVQYYRWKRRYEQEGLDGLYDKSRAPKSHPNRVPWQTTRRLEELSRENPLWGARRLQKALQAEGLSLSAPTIQKYLELTLGNAGDAAVRCAKVYRKIYTNGLEWLSEEQKRLLWSIGPISRGSGKWHLSLGECVTMDTLELGNVAGIGHVQVQAAVDTATLRCWYELHEAGDDHAAIRLVCERIAPEINGGSFKLNMLETPSCRRYGYKSRLQESQFHAALEGICFHKYREERFRSGFITAFKRELLPELKRIVRKKKQWTLEGLIEAVKRGLRLKENKHQWRCWELDQPQIYRRGLFIEPQ